MKPRLIKLLCQFVLVDGEMTRDEWHNGGRQFTDWSYKGLELRGRSNTFLTSRIPYADQ